MKTHRFVLCWVLVLLYTPQGVGQNTDFPVDLDGDGASTYGDRAVFDAWLARGGKLDYALSNAEVKGNVIDLSGFFRSPLAALSVDSQLAKGGGQGSGSSSTQGSGASAQSGCTQPPDSPYFTRRLPPGVSPTKASFNPRTTPDGQFIVFHYPGDLGFGTNGAQQVYRFERSTGGNGILSLVSIDPNTGNPFQFGTFNPAISDDGKVIVFNSIVPQQVYARDLRSSPVTRLLSKTPSGLPGNGASNYPSVSGDGTVCAFRSGATDLVSGDTNNHPDVFRIGTDGTSPPMEMVSKSDKTTDPLSNADMSTTSTTALTGMVGNVLNATGNLIVFEGAPTNWTFSGLGSNPPGIEQLFVRDLTTVGSPHTYLVSKVNTGTIGNNISHRGSISTDGTWIAYSSLATNLTSTAPNPENVFFISLTDVKKVTGSPLQNQVLNRTSGVPTGVCNLPMITRVTVAPTTVVNRIAFASDAADLIASDSNGFTDVYLFDDRGPAFTRRFSVTSTGTEAVNGASTNPDVTADGNHVVYESAATNLIPNDTNGFSDIFETLRPQGPFVRGNADMIDDTVTDADANLILDWLFSGGSTPPSLDAADANDDATIDISDPIYISNYLHHGGQPPPCPFSSPQPSCCGADPPKGSPAVGDALTSAATRTCTTTCN